MTVKELYEIAFDMMLNANDEDAEVVVKISDERENLAHHVLYTRKEHTFSKLVKGEYTIENGETRTYIKPEYKNKVVLVI